MVHRGGMYGGRYAVLAGVRCTGTTDGGGSGGAVIVGRGRATCCCVTGVWRGGLE